MANAKHDDNHVPTLTGVSSVDGTTPINAYVDPVTHRLLVDSANGSGTVTSVSVVTANGISGSVATATTTPAITLTLGAITPTSVNGLTISSTTGTFSLTNAKTLAVTNTLTLSGTDSTVMTFPSTSATIARTDAANTFTGVQTMTSPVLNTSTQTPLVIGGTGTTQTLILRSTSGVGTTGADIVLQTGNNGAVEAGRIYNSGIVSNSLQSGARVYRDSTNQTVTNGVATKVEYNAENWDTQGEYDSVTNFRFTATVAGKYQVNGGVQMLNMAADKQMILDIYVNGSLFSTSTYVTVTSGDNWVKISDIVSLAANGYVEMFITQNDTTSRDIYFNQANTFMSIQKLC